MNIQISLDDGFVFSLHFDVLFHFSLLKISNYNSNIFRNPKISRVVRSSLRKIVVSSFQLFAKPLDFWGAYLAIAFFQENTEDFRSV